MSIPVSDLVLAGVILLAVLLGWWAGTINVVAKIGSLVVAYIMARIWSGYLAAVIVDALPDGFDLHTQAGDKLNAFLTLFGDADGLTAHLFSILAFVAIFVLVCWLIRLLARALTDLFGHGLLGSLNHALGGVLAGLLAVGSILLLSEIFLPAFADMGLGAGLQQFFDQSCFVLPGLRNLLPAVQNV